MTQVSAKTATMPTIAVTGISSLVCETEIVMTPVIVLLVALSNSVGLRSLGPVSLYSSPFGF